MNTRLNDESVMSHFGGKFHPLVETLSTNNSRDTLPVFISNMSTDLQVNMFSF